MTRAQVKRLNRPMIYRSKTPAPEHDIRLIVVPGELLSSPASDYRQIESGGKQYDVIDYCTHKKGEYLGTLLPLLSTGQLFTDEDIFRKYVNSDKVVFFICKLNTNKS